MKTILIWESLGASTLQYYVLDGDFSHLDGCYVNSPETTDETADELITITEHNTPFLQFPLDEVFNAGPGNIKVIEAGFLP